ncbi:MAG: Sialic acid TRAP transporter permease protein SiaT [Syntrophorhabdus sp. PtaU1.Bin058]|nr:MAG: Sialic acid TRAP transporter permease protein SiaT [Syntrophorhabdus sp. PtaU1.Bin058]
MDTELQNKLDKLHDVEIGYKRTLGKGPAAVLAGIGFLMTFFHVYVLLFRAIDPWIFRSIHILFGSALLFALIPGWKKAPRDRIHPVDYIFFACLCISVVYILWNLEDVIFRMGVDPTGWDILFSIIFTVVVLEMVRRTTGWALVITAVVAILYGSFGQYLPGFLTHRGYNISRLFTYIASLDGIMSVPIQASATYVFIFVIFGAFLDASGASMFFVDFAKSVAGGYRGGPGKVSIVSSAMIGTVSGSSVANVVVDGVFNIPMMKASGFQSTVAGAVEAMNSTAGQIVPPVMGTAAFIMAEILGISYAKVCIAAIIPAALYYVAAYFMIDFYAAKNGLKGVPRHELPRFWRLIGEKGYLLIPLILLIICLMVFQMSPFRGVMWATIALVALSWLKKESRLTIGKIWTALSVGPQSAIEIVATCAAAGIIIGVISLTGLGGKFAMIIITYSAGNLLLSLFFTMCITIILGMGLPTTAAYAISASMLTPALIKLGVAPIASHLFVFYFACLSAITPPVAVAAYAAAAIAKARAWNVGWAATMFASAGFIIPFMFAYGKELLLIGGPVAIGMATITSIFGVILLSAAVQGWCIRLGNLSYFERALMLAGSLLLMKPGWVTDVIGVAIVVAIYFWKAIYKKRGSSALAPG